VFTLNVLSICYFAALLLLIYGFAEQVSGWRVAGLLAVFFTLGSGTLHFFWRAYTHAQRGIEYIITHSFLTKRRPDLLSMIPDGSFGYNGNMFNLFYFVQERQLAGGCLVLLFFSLMLGYCKSMPTRERIVVGSILGLTLQWHLYAFVAIVVAFCMSAGLLHSVRATLQVLIPAIAAAGIQIVCFASQTGLNAYKSGLFSHPTIDFSFASLPDLYPISLAGAVSYWIFALGVKAVLFGAFIFLSPTIGIRRRLVATVALVVACLFLLTNCIRLSPQSIYDNHKWSRPMMLLIDIAIAAAIVGCWRRFRSLPVHAFLVGAILLCSMTGLRENIGYFRSQKMVQVVRVDSELARTIGSSPPDARFLSDYPIEVLAQGRRLYVTRASELPGNPRFDQNYLATEQRDEIAARIWEAPSLSTFCDTAVAAGVDFVTYTPKRQPQWPLHVAAQCASGPLQTTSGAWLRVLSTACACQER
jgi:hypothetical protein